VPILVADLAAVDVIATATSATTVVVALQVDAVWDLVRDLLVAADVGVRRLHRRTRSLEEVFLEGGSAGLIAGSVHQGSDR
jgi:hypothetical protein